MEPLVLRTLRFASTRKVRNCALKVPANVGNIEWHREHGRKRRKRKKPSCPSPCCLKYSEIC
jgi:uncharacterized protein YjbK